MQIFAQQLNLNLSILNAQNEAFENATALLVHLPDSIIVEKKVLKSNDFFNVQSSSDYLLKITAVSKKNFEKKIHIGTESIKLVVVLNNNVEVMKSVIIVSKKPLMKEEDDKTIVDATTLSNSSTNAFEVIEKTPGTIIDQDGNVYLNSTTPATIF